jgi:hypothetical protein
VAGPGSAPYEIITTGTLDAAHVHAPPPVLGDSWQPQLPDPFVSAYVSAAGAEPDFTNLAMTKNAREPFVGTLDYIFLSRGDWKATSVRELPARDAVLPQCRSYPIASEPSDHVAVWTDIELDSPPSSK